MFTALCYLPTTESCRTVDLQKPPLWYAACFLPRFRCTCFSYAGCTPRRFQTLRVQCSIGRIFSKIYNSYVENMSMTSLETLGKFRGHRDCNLAAAAVWALFRMMPAGGRWGKREELGRGYILINSQPKSIYLCIRNFSLPWTWLLAVTLEERICCAGSRSWTGIFNFWRLNFLHSFGLI